MENLHWLGHASFLISGDGLPAVYIDPFAFTKKDMSGFPKADIVLVTHSHRDHLSPESLELIVTKKTIIIAPAGCEAANPHRVIGPGDTIELPGVSIEAVPAYNTVKQFHPRESNFVGYVVGIAGKRYYHSGDTDRIPEMKGLNPDVAMLPVGGTYTMTADEAVGAALDLGAPTVVPMHYGTIVGSPEDGERLRELAGDRFNVVVMKAEG